MILDASLRLAGIGLLATLALACHREAASVASPATGVSTASVSAEAVPAAPAAGACAPVEALNAMDTRQSVPLQPMMAWHQKQDMMEHLEVIQRITDGLAREDWDAIAEASALIESSPQMQQVCEHMGAGAEGFTERALDFHRRADAIREAALAHDGPGVLRATSSTLQACTSCHATYRQDVVDAATWQARTGSAHDPAMMDGKH